MRRRGADGDCVSHICQVNRVQRRCHCVREVSAGGSRENVGSGRVEVTEYLYRRKEENCNGVDLQDGAKAPEQQRLRHEGQLCEAIFF